MEIGDSCGWPAQVRCTAGAAEAHHVVSLVIELDQVGLGPGISQQGLGAHHYQGLAELAVDLAPQQVEVVGRGCAVGNLRQQRLSG